MGDSGKGMLSAALRQIPGQREPSAVMPTLIGGKRHLGCGGDPLESINPATGELIASFTRCGVNDVRHAVDEAERAFPAWSAQIPARQGGGPSAAG